MLGLIICNLFLREMEHSKESQYWIRLGWTKGVFPLRNARSLLSSLTLLSPSFHSYPNLLPLKEKRKCVAFNFVFCLLPSFQPQIFTSLIIHSLFPGGILPTSQAGANPDVQDGSLPAGGAGVNPATQGTPAGRLPTPSGTDDDFAVTTPADIQRSTRAIEEATTESANGKFS